MRMTLTLTVSILTLAHALPALAQSEDEHIVVTGTRTATPILRLPADVDVIDVEAMQSQGVASLADALAGVPGLDTVPLGGFGQQTSLFSSGANSNHTLVLFDGIRLNDAASPGSSFDAGQDTLAGLERIEIVQGPMSAVYGSDAIGGVVNILPRRGADGALNASFDLSAGARGALNGVAGIDGTLGGFRYALTAEGYATDGHDLVPERMTTHTDDSDPAESTTLTGVFDLDLTDAFALDLIVRHREARADFDAFQYTSSFEEYRADDPDIELSQNNLSLARVGATWRIAPSVSLRAAAGGVRQEREEKDGGFVTSAYEGERQFGDLTLDWSAEALGPLSAATIIVGLETQTETVDIDQGFATVAEEQDQHGAFITAQGDIARLTVTAAARVDDYEGFGTQSTWRGGASYALADSARLYAVYGTSFRAPTLYERFITFGDPNLDPEKGEAWEVGADFAFAAFAQQDGVEFGLVYRSLDIEDLIDFGPAFTYVNIDQAEIESAEARVAIHPLAWLTVRAAYVRTDAIDATTGDALLRRPEETWSAALEAEHGVFSARLSWRQVGDRADQIYGDNGFWEGVGVTPSYDVWRASAAWDVMPEARIYLAIENVADENYEPSNAFAGAPRTMTIGVRTRL